jgi:predicted permease
MDNLLRDIRVAFRSLLKQRSFTLVALLTLALGTGATTAIFSVVNGVLLRPLPYADAERIVSVWQTARDNPQPSVIGTVSHLNYLDWKREAKSFESLALYSRASFILTGIGEAELVPGGVATPGMFSVFKAAPIMGRDFTEAEDRPKGGDVVIVSYAFWKDRLGGREDVLGSTIQLSSRPTRIIGVAPAGFDFPNHARLWTPMQNDDENCGRGCVYTDGIARLASGVTVAQARSEMEALAAALEKTYPVNFNVTVGVMGLQEDTVRNVRTALLFILGSVGMVLLISCANVANLVLVRGTARQNEIAVRSALGGSRSRLLTHLLSENLILALLGGVSGLILAWWGIDALKRIAPRSTPRLDEVAFDSNTFLFAIGISAFTMLLFGLIPALQLTRSPLAGWLSSRGDINSGRSARSRATLVVAEVSLSLILLAGAGLLMRSLTALQMVNPGFSADNLTIVNLAMPTQRYPGNADVLRAANQLDERFEAIAGVERVARISGLPLGPSEDVQTFSRTDQPPPPPGQGPSALYRVIDSDYFRTLGIPLKAGRDFEPADSNEAPPVAIISEKMARQFWPNEDPLGKAFSISGRPARTIVGIVANVRSQQLTSEAAAEMYVPHAQNRSMTFVIRGHIPSPQILAAVRGVVKEIDPNMPLIRPGTLQALVDQQMESTRFCLLLASLFSVLAVALASVGAYGVVSYAVVQRTREIGLRLALGASPLSLVGRIMWDGFRPAVIGIAVGLAGALVVTKTMQALLFNVVPHDPLTFIVATLVLALLVVIATLIPARRATRVPPAVTLRS